MSAFSKPASAAPFSKFVPTKSGWFVFINLQPVRSNCSLFIPEFAFDNIFDHLFNI
jgi:hypothetical protein